MHICYFFFIENFFLLNNKDQIIILSEKTAKGSGTYKSQIPNNSARQNWIAGIIKKKTWKLNKKQGKKREKQTDTQRIEYTLTVM